VKHSGLLQTPEYGASSYQEQPDFVDNSSSNFVSEMAKLTTPEKSDFLPTMSDESALLSQLNEACQLSSALQRGLDMCSSINAQNKAEKNSCNTQATTSDHPVARQLNELRHLYRQVCGRHTVLRFC